MDSNYDVPMYIAKSNIKLEQFVAIVENKKIYGTLYLEQSLITTETIGYMVPLYLAKMKTMVDN